MNELVVDSSICQQQVLTGSVWCARTIFFVIPPWGIILNAFIKRIVGRSVMSDFSLIVSCVNYTEQTMAIEIPFHN